MIGLAHGLTISFDSAAFPNIMAFPRSAKLSRIYKCSVY